MPLFFGQGLPVAGIDLATVLDSALPTLGAAGFADLTFWTEDELYDSLDEAVKALARSCGVFVERDATTAIVPGTATYAAPARHLSTIHVSIGTRALLAATVQEIEALDDDWPDTADDDPERFMAGDGTEEIRLYPKPGAAAAGTLAVIFHRYPPTIASGATVISAPRAVREYFLFLLLAEARAKESKAAMPEVSDYFRQLADLHLQAIEGYWGDAQ